MLKSKTCYGIISSIKIVTRQKDEYMTLIYAMKINKCKKKIKKHEIK